MSRSEERIGLKSGWFLTVIPYSVSMPMTFGMAMSPPVADSGSPSADTTPTTAGRRVRGRGGGGARPPPLFDSYRYWPVLTTFSTSRCFSFVSPMSGFT